MKRIVDIHTHILSGLDDGAKSREDMFAMLTQAYEDGTEAICLTPHYEPESFSYTPTDLRNRFAEAKAYASEKLPGLALYLGNEISFRDDCVERLGDGDCMTLGNGRYVLVDFFGVSDVKHMCKIFERLWCAGYMPIVAHVERYDFLRGKLHEVAAMSRDGVLFQVNSHSIMTEDRASLSKKMAKKLLARGLVDLVASDAHDLQTRLPRLYACREYVSAAYGEEYAELLFHVNPQNILENKSIQI